jgi:prolipoprotein diacylglyceryltransferase
VSTYLALWLLGAVAGGLTALAVLRARGVVSLVSHGAIWAAWLGLGVGASWQYRIEFMSPLEAFPVHMGTVLGGGLRLPLGVLLGGILAWLWCRAVGLPWRETGDALAVGTMVTTAVGRFGCLVNGCCMGRVCPAWLASACLAPWPGTEAFMNQVMSHQIAGSEVRGLPALPLPLLFTLSSLAILVVLLWVLRRGAKPGLALTTACFLGSLAKLGLEELRAVARPPGLMFWIPAVTAVTSACVLLAALWSRCETVELAGTHPEWLRPRPRA